MVSAMLMISSAVLPVTMAIIMENIVWCGALTFISVFSFWCINYIAAEIEMPFGDDLNDLPVAELQEGMNTALLMMMDNKCTSVPAFDFRPEFHRRFLTIACPASLISN